jgi:putative ABC transport system permease protein
MPRRAEYGNVLYLHPFADSHLGSNHITFGGGITQTSDIRYVYVFSAVGVFVLVIACINFMNLTTARSARRAAEIGVRKVVGAQRGQLIRQFLGESFGLTLLGFALAIGMVGLIGPAFNAAFSTKLDVSRVLSPSFIQAGVAFILGVGLLAGIYPAFYLSAFNPVSVLKDGGTPRSSGTLVRKVLVITQFAISSTLIIGTGLVLEQFDFLRNRNLGFNTDQVLVINIPDPAAMGGKLETLKAELLQHPDILKTAASSVTLGRNFIRGGGATYESDEGPMEDINTRQMAVGYDFISTYGIEILEGRDFSREHALDVASFESETFEKPGSFLVNQEFLKRAGLKNPIGKSMKTGRGEFGEIVGVMKDFNFYTLHHQMEALSVRLGPGEMFRRFAVKVKPDRIRETVAFIENKWQTTYDQPMAYTFLDDFFDAQYRREEITGKLIASFSGIAIPAIICPISIIERRSSSRVPSPPWIKRFNSTTIRSKSTGRNTTDSISFLRAGVDSR